MKIIKDSKIADPVLKSEILKKLFSLVNFQKYKYVILKSKDQLQTINPQDMLVTYQLNSFNYLLFFIALTYNGNISNYSVLIRREKITMGMNRIDINDVEICNVITYDFYLTNKLFNGTIIEGKLAIDKNYNLFNIIDIYYLFGDSKLEMNVVDKLSEFKSYISNIDSKSPILSHNDFIEFMKRHNDLSHLESRMKSDLSNCNKFDEYLTYMNKNKYISNIVDICINDYYETSNLKECLSQIFKLNYNINGIVIMPKKSSIFYVYSNKSDMDKYKELFMMNKIIFN